MTILSALSSISRDDFSSNSLPMTPHRRAFQTAGRTVHYAQALPQAILGNILPQEVNIALTGLLHDLVFLLEAFVREPYLPY